MKWLLLALVLICGCSPFLTAGKDATQGAVSVATDEATKKKLNSLITEAVKSARDEALGPNTQDQLNAIVANLRAQVKLAVQEALVDPKTLQALDQVREELVGASLRADGDALREQLFGAPLQADLNNLIDSASPHLTQAVQSAIQGSIATIKIDASSLKSQADQEAQKWKPIAIGFAVGSGFLLIGLILACVLIHRHQRTIKALMMERR